MDISGKWHDLTEKEMDRSDVIPPERSTIALSYGEQVLVTKVIGEGRKFFLFDEAKGTKVILSQLRQEVFDAHFLMGEDVWIQNVEGQKAKAQVWRYQNGCLTLRTLPVGA